MNFSLIITTYNSPDSLLLVLKSVEAQYILPNEIIIADDGSLPSTKLLIDNFLSGSSLIVLHSWQKEPNLFGSIYIFCYSNGKLLVPIDSWCYMKFNLWCYFNIVLTAPC